MAKILVVDDEADLEVLIKQKFRQKIRNQEYEFVFASNGRHALEQIAAHSDISLMLSDINMPEMDGLTLLSKILEQKLLIKSIVISAYGDMENIRTAMNRGAFDFIIKPVNFSDLEITIERTLVQVQQMKETLIAIKENNILKMYVDETVLHFMGGQQFENSLLSNETVEGTIVFIDICSFTKISETETPDIVVSLLNEYFDVMVKEIVLQKGIVDKFIGDAIMAVFKGPYHLDRALDASLAIRENLSKLPVVAGKSGFRPRVSIGLNSGEMISGNIGSSSLRRLDYTVIGDTVNIAARLQSAAEEGQILLTEENFRKVKDSFVCKKVGDIIVKNKSAPLKAYELIH